MNETVYDTPNSDLQGGGSSLDPLTITQVLFSFKGRVPRSTYWYTILGTFLFFFFLGLLSALFQASEEMFTMVILVLYIPVIWVSLAVQVKRWHDRDKSGWWVLITLIPIIGSIWALVENGFLAGDEGMNSYGFPSK